jgi:hypothetical protein
MPLSPDLGEEFGRYRIVRPLGSGGMATVYLAEDTILGRRVALKVPQLESADDIQRFQREARVAATLNHPNLCGVHDVGVHEGVHYLTMPYVEGLTLKQRLDTEGKPSMAEAVEWIYRLALAMQVLHEHGLVHRDLKPANILLRHGREPVVTDFGLARAFGGDAMRLTQTGAPLGTPAYMSPEQIRADAKAIGPATDVYSLGVILYELLTGQLPFKSATLESLYFQIFSVPPPPPSDAWPELGTALDPVCAKALAKEPAERFATMAEFAAALRPFLGPEHGGLPAPAPAVPAPAPAGPWRGFCPGCGQKLKVPAGMLNKRVRCPKCQRALTVPGDLVTDTAGLATAPARTDPTPAPPAGKSGRRKTAVVSPPPAPPPEPPVVEVRVRRRVPKKARGRNEPLLVGGLPAWLVLLMAGSLGLGMLLVAVIIWLANRP